MSLHIDVNFADEPVGTGTLWRWMSLPAGLALVAGLHLLYLHGSAARQTNGGKAAQDPPPRASTFTAALAEREGLAALDRQLRLPVNVRLAELERCTASGARVEKFKQSADDTATEWVVVIDREDRAAELLGCLNGETVGEWVLSSLEASANDAPGTTAFRLTLRRSAPRAGSAGVK